MGLSENEAKPVEKHDSQQKSAPQDKKEKLSDKDKPLTKVIIRRLPPSMTQEEFINQVSPIPDYDYIYTIKGDYSLGENAFSRVYVNFSNQEDIYVFKEKFDNYVFVDGKGHEYAAVVEYASFQKVPKRRRPRQDPKAGTIESDPAYIEFLEHLNEQPNQEEKAEYTFNLAAANENKNDITTPLLDYLKQRKVERQRIREEKRDERRKKEHDRKKLREDDRKKRVDEKKHKSIAKKDKDVKEREKDKDKEKPKDIKEEGKEDKDETGASPAKTTSEVKKVEKTEKLDKPKTDKFKTRNKNEEQRKKNKSKYEERKEKDFRNRRDEHRERDKDKDNKKDSGIPPKDKEYQNPRKYEDKKQEPRPEPKKVKKYSERREERKNVEEAKRNEGANKEKPENKPEKHEKTEEFECYEEKPREPRNEKGGKGRDKGRREDARPQRRIRNKDRPTMQLYKPGMLRKKSIDNDREDIVLDKCEAGEDKQPEKQHESKETEKDNN